MTDATVTGAFARGLAALARVAKVAVAAASLAATAALAQDFRVTLLGTGSPQPFADRFGMSTLVEAGGRRLLFDVGRGATIRLWQLHIPLGSIDATFVSHFHSDHTVGIPDLWLSGWIQRPFGMRKSPFGIYGPKGTAAMMGDLRRAYDADIRIRTVDENDPPEGIAVDAHDHDEGVIYEQDGVRVTAITVDHGDVIKPAFGWRIDYGGRSVVLSGDTRYAPHLIEAARGAQLFVHEVSAASPAMLANAGIVQAIFAHHTSPEEAGRAFAAVRPKLAVYSHLVLLGDATHAPPSTDEVVRQTRATYDGPLVVGEDLMQFDVRDDGVRRIDRATAR